MEESTVIKQENMQSLELLPDGVKSLNEMRKWSMFLAILGFIGVGFMLIAAIFMGAIFGMLDVFADESIPGGVGIAISMLYLVIAVLYFFPCYFLLQFSIKAKKACLETNNDEFTGAIHKLKSYYKFIGIMAIVVMALYPIIIIAVVAGGFLANM